MPNPTSVAIVARIRAGSIWSSRARSLSSTGDRVVADVVADALLALIDISGTVAAVTVATERKVRRVVPGS